VIFAVVVAHLLWRLAQVAASVRRLPEGTLQLFLFVSYFYICTTFYNIIAQTSANICNM
jgi:hypothetical protein